MLRQKILLFSLIIAISFNLSKSEIEIPQEFLTMDDPLIESFSTEDPNYHENPDDYLIVKGVEITDVNCKAPYGAKSTQGGEPVCICSVGQANYPSEGVDGVFCHYEQHNQLTGFLLELLIPLGIGHFIIGNNGLGVGKLILTLLPCILPCLFICCGDGMKALVTGILSFTGFAVFIWYIFDLVWFGLNKYRDSKYVPLKSW